MAIPQDDFAARYPLRVRFIIASVLGFLVIIFYGFPRFLGQENAAIERFKELVETIDIPPTQQLEIPPPPSRPSIPVESEDEEIAEDITIEEMELESFEWDAPPPAPAEGPIIRFIPYDEPPVPIGGYGAIIANLVYPEIARKTGIQGTVVLSVYVSEKGFVEEIVVEQGVPQTGMDEAAIRAVRKVRFKPAKQRDRALGVWIAIPIEFRIAGYEGYR